MGLTRTVAFSGLVTNLIQNLLDNGLETRLIVCGTKIEFLVQLAAAVRAQRTNLSTASSHDLLTKTIGLLAHASRIQLTFCPSLEALRAYLAVLSSIKGITPGVETDSPQRKLLVILDMVALHAAAAELSAQGLSRTLASAAEAASRMRMDLTLCECTNAVTPSSVDWGESLWDKQIPLLNGSVRMRGEESVLGRRGVSVKQVAQRWFSFDEEKRICKNDDVD